MINQSELFDEELLPFADDLSSDQEDGAGITDEALAVPADALDRLAADAAELGGEWTEPEEYRGSVGRTMFDTPSSQDNSITVLLPRENIAAAPAQSLVRINSLPDRRCYLGVVTQGPFAEPDGLRGDAPIVVTTTVKGGIFMPRFHGRVQVELLGEEREGQVVPPRFRPLPNSPVFPLDSDATQNVLHVEGDITLGLAVGHDRLEVAIPSDRKSVLPRHTAILGTTGAGKSTTVSSMVDRCSRAGVAVVLIDTEGEYTAIDQATDDPQMIGLLGRRNREAAGVPKTLLFHLIGRDTTNPKHPRRREFGLRFCSLSPYLVTELLEMTEAQQQRYMVAYDLTKRLLRELKAVPLDEKKLEELDELEEGFPGMTLQHVYDIVRACALHANKKDPVAELTVPAFTDGKDKIVEAIKSEGNSIPSNWFSWLALLGKLGRLKRLRIFDGQAPALNFQHLTIPGAVSIIDLSDTDSVQIRNLVIAELLRGLQIQQEINYEAAEKAGQSPPRTLVVVEEAHEFLSSERVKQMPVLFQQVARIARRGRKRWLGMIFVTQLPQHLPDEVLGLVNNYILHRIADAGVIARLKRSAGGIDESLWNRLPSLAAGQAIVSAASMARPLVVAMDPTPCKLRMVE